MDRQYFDIAFAKECKDFGKKLGFEKVFVDKFKIEIGGDRKQNEKTVRKKIDILLDPIDQNKKDFDISLAQVAKQNNITIAFSLKKILEKTKVERVNYIRSVKDCIKICNRMNNNVIIISGAKHKFDMRNPEQLAALGALLDMSKSKQLWSISKAYEVIM